MNDPTPNLPEEEGRNMGATDRPYRGMLTTTSHTLSQSGVWTIHYYPGDDPGTSLSGVRANPYPPRLDGGAAIDPGLHEFLSASTEK